MNQMNQINSLIIEGDIDKDTITTGSINNIDFAKFCLRNKKYAKKNGKTVEEVTEVPIHCYGSMTENVSYYLDRFSKAKVIGVIKNNNGLYVLAEHIDFA